MRLTYGREITKILSLTSICVIMLFPSVVGVSFGKDNESVSILSGKPVTIDGMWTTKTEWTDASEIKITDKELTAYLRAKHDTTFVYVLIDFISDQGLDRSGDLAVVCFDTRGDGSAAPLPDDYCFYRATRAGEFKDGIIQGNGVEWTTLQEARIWDPYETKFDAAIGYSHVNDPYDSANKHVIYELRIPVESYGLEEMMRFYVYVNDAYSNSFIEWPANAGGKQLKLIVKDVLPSPNEWGNVELKLDKPQGEISEEVPVLSEEEEEEGEKKAEVRVLAKQIKDLVIVRLRNMQESTAEIHAFDIMLPDDSLLKASRGPGEWSKQTLAGNEVVFSTLTRPVKAGDKVYFMLKVDDDVKPNIQWTAYGADNNKLADGSAVPFRR